MKKIILLCSLFSLVDLLAHDTTLLSEDAFNEQLEQLDEKEEDIRIQIAALEKEREKYRHNVEFSGNAFTTCRWTNSDCKTLEKLYKSASADLEGVVKKLGLQNKMLSDVQTKRRDFHLDRLLAKNQ